MSGIAGARLKQERKDWRRDPNRPFVSVNIGEVPARVLTAAPGILCSRCVFVVKVKVFGLEAKLPSTLSRNILQYVCGLGV